MSDRKRYVLVGTGSRANAYLSQLADTHKDHAQLIAMCDLSPTRMAYYNKLRQEEFGQPPVDTWHPDDFVANLKKHKPDGVLVITPDATHHEFVIPALEAGCMAITEKPMTTRPEYAKAMIDATERTGVPLRVTFNMRYSPFATTVRKLMMSGVIGTPQAVDLRWSLNTSHGADYFRRWHRNKDISGGLLIHKATHHFDMVNWWIDSTPETVFSLGKLAFYGKENAEARGEKVTYDRYTGHREEAANDPFAMFLDRDNAAAEDNLQQKEILSNLYLNAEKDTGYIRDQNVMGEGITIEDTISVNARYRNGVLFTYSLTAYSPWEGFQLIITGDKGRIEFDSGGTFHLVKPEYKTNPVVKKQYSLRVCPMFELPYDVEIPKVKGGHGGADTGLYHDLFVGDRDDPLGQRANHWAGAASLLVGLCANKSIETGQVVKADDLIKIPETF